MVERCQKTDSHSLLARCGIALSLLVLSIFLFALPQPNLLTVQGIPFLAYFALVPVFLLVRFVSWKTVWLLGVAYGVGAYCLFTYWLATFHPLGIFVISFMYGLYLMVAFPLLKAAASLFPKRGWLVQGVVRLRLCKDPRFFRLPLWSPGVFPLEVDAADSDCGCGGNLGAGCPHYLYLCLVYGSHCRCLPEQGCGGLRLQVQGLAPCPSCRL